MAISQSSRDLSTPNLISIERAILGMLKYPDPGRFSLLPIVQTFVVICIREVDGLPVPYRLEDSKI